MTVEQSPLEHFSQKQQQLRNQSKNAVQPSNNSGVIDLTNDGAEKEDDLQKAIALSLKEQQKVLGGQVSIEDQDISRVVEASLAESKAVGTKRKRGEVWQDPPNPHDRKRNSDWPVGLKNVGNTCWFSAVIQSLFHLPVFRRLVLNFVPQKEWTLDIPDTKERRNLLFMQELRKLFALMACTKRKYVDPSQALEELKEAFPDSSGTDSQQDVSEFSHKLLEWLEEAFKLDASNLYSSAEKSDIVVELPELQRNPRNPMLDLFYGHFLSEGHNEGRTFSNEEAFGQYPLQVNGFNDIHESLEAAMAQEIESCHDVMSKSGQESWFTCLPPVLLFELSRFQFNQLLGRPEKIHNKLEFPEIIYMDRYMEYNKNITRGKREEVRKLKVQRDRLQNNLEKYLSYGSGPKRLPLYDVLQYTLEFVESKNITDISSPAVSCDDVEMASPASAASMGNESPCNSPNKVPANDFPLSSTPPVTNFHQGHGNSMVSADECEQMQEGEPPPETVPSPQHVSDVEFRVLQSCLKRWRMEVENDVKELQDQINRIDSKIREIYSEETLLKKPYRLHAVLVHEGQAASGHYWAYVYCPRRRLWLKFNDVTVTDATWAELQKDSMGGHHYASAYCLMYLDKQRPELFEVENECEIMGPESLEELPKDLQRYVEDDNHAFQLELEQWDVEQSRKKDSSTMTTLGGGDGECTIVAEKRMVFGDSCPVRPTVSTLASEHASIPLKTTLSKVDQLAKTINAVGIAKALDEVVRCEALRLKRIARTMSPTEDLRLQHIGVYLLLNSDNSDMFLQWSVLEQYSIPELAETNNGHLLRLEVINRLEKLKQTLNENCIAEYRVWHEIYHKFRKLVTLFILGVQSYHNKEYHHGLASMISCCNYNSSLISSHSGEKRGLNRKLLAHYRRQCVLRVNEMAAAQFESQNLKDVQDALDVVDAYVVPSMEFLTAQDAFESDGLAVEEIRNRWCTMLGEDMESEKQEMLRPCLHKLLDPGSDYPRSPSAPLLRISDLDDSFRQTMLLIVKSGEYNIALQTK